MYVYVCVFVGSILLLFKLHFKTVLTCVVFCFVFHIIMYVYFHACSLAVNLTYYGIGLNIGILGGNIYVNFTISTVMELIGITFPLFALNKFGRKKMHVTSLLIGGTACLSTIFTSLYASEGMITFRVC
jgi:hypothetical protein